MASIVALLAQILAMVPQLVSAGIDIADLVSKTKAVIDANKVPGDAEWDALDATVARLQAPVRDTSGDV